jgi:hypothetical protein
MDHRLRTSRGEINDRQALVAQRDIEFASASVPFALTVWPARALDRTCCGPLVGVESEPKIPQNSAHL